MPIQKCSCKTFYSCPINVDLVSCRFKSGHTPASIFLESIELVNTCLALKVSTQDIGSTALTVISHGAIPAVQTYSGALELDTRNNHQPFRCCPVLLINRWPVPNNTLYIQASYYAAQGILIILLCLFQSWWMQLIAIWPKLTVLFKIRQLFCVDTYNPMYTYRKAISLIWMYT